MSMQTPILIVVSKFLSTLGFSKISSCLSPEKELNIS